MNHTSLARTRASRLGCLAVACAILEGVAPSPLHAESSPLDRDGLGPPDIAVQPYGTLVGNGWGLADGSGRITFTVPPGAEIRQVLLYWNGYHSEDDNGDDTLTLENADFGFGPVQVTGTLIGGPRRMLISQEFRVSSTYRADITGLGLLSQGPNRIDIADVDFDRRANGASIVVIVDDHVTFNTVEILDGQDVSLARGGPPYDRTEARSFRVIPADRDRDAELTLIAGGVLGDAAQEPSRPNLAVVTFDGSEPSPALCSDTDNYGGCGGANATACCISREEGFPFVSFNYYYWDHLSVSIVIPAGADTVTFQAFSAPPRASHQGLPADFVLVAAALTVSQYCELELDKQVSCNGGVTFGEICHPDAPMDPTDIEVRYLGRTESSTAALYDCVLQDSNGLVLPLPVGLGTLPGRLPWTVLYQTASLECGPDLPTAEPSTAHLNCECYYPGSNEVVWDSDQAELCHGFCGNGDLGFGEACDDGNADDTDACPGTCLDATCGDGFVHAGVEECDDGNEVDTDACDNDCATNFCGDGQVNRDEECDDGNPDDADQCDNNCLSNCGDGVLNSGEACDDGNDLDSDACTRACLDATCGDGIVRLGIEECDDANDDDGDACLGTCVGAMCGDGIVWAGVEECDDGDQDDRDACGNGCRVNRFTAEWKPAPDMQTPRDSHTATLLLSGEVLVAGGRSDFALRTVELYDPLTGTWSVAEPMTAARSGHTATLLPTGDVLIVGGAEAGAAAEVYHPATGGWSTTDPIHGLRRKHTANVLPSGRVLVVGGETVDGPLATVELYDPTDGTWAGAADLQLSRTSHATMLLPSGELLVIGGSSAGGLPLASGEIYDPDTDFWVPLANAMAEARSELSATLFPSGEVVVAGGGTTVERFDPDDGIWSIVASLEIRGHQPVLLPAGDVLLVGVTDTGADMVLDFESQELVEVDALPSARDGYTATLLPSGEVLLVGGLGATTSRPVDNRLFAPPRYTVRALQPLLAIRDRHTATLLPNGHVLMVGGVWDETQPVEVAEVHDLQAGARTEVAPPIWYRRDHAATLLTDGTLLVSGGEALTSLEIFNWQDTASAEIFDPVSGSWTPLENEMTQARSGHQAVVLPSGEVLVAGGATNAEIFDPATRTWRDAGYLGGTHATLTPLYDGRVLALAAALDQPGVARLFDPAAEAWESAAPLFITFSNHGATLLPSGDVLVISEASPPDVLLYNPVTDTWRFVASPSAGAISTSVHLLTDGKVLVSGGALFDPATETWGEQALPLLSQQGSVLASAGFVTTGGFEVLLIETPGSPADRRPVIDSASGAGPDLIRYGSPLTIGGNGFRGDSEASSGRTASSAVDYPLLQARRADGEQLAWLRPDPVLSFWDDPLTLTVSELPPFFDPGWYFVTVFTAGIPSESRLVEFQCSHGFLSQPDAVVEVNLDTCGAQEDACTATFDAISSGGRWFTWQQCAGTLAQCAEDGDGWADIPGAVEMTYVTPPLNGPETGTRYRVRAETGCTTDTSAAALLRIIESEAPATEVLSPNGGEYWQLSDPPEILNSEFVTWSMSDNVRICALEVKLRHSNGGGPYVDTATLVSEDLGESCSSPGLTQTSLLFEMPQDPPSGSGGSRYKIEVTVRDHAGNATTVKSDNPFYMVRANPDSVKTLILTHLPRMTFGLETATDADDLRQSLRELAAHPRVQGFIVELVAEELYGAWDADPGNPQLANRVLFGDGQHEGVHQTLLELLEAFTGVEYLIVVGDDRVVPFARLDDRTTLLDESTYVNPDPEQPEEPPALDGLRSTVGRALALNHFLTDDPLAAAEPIAVDDLAEADAVFLPDLAVGRLVENPDEIVAAIASFISQDGVLDLSSASDPTERKVFITGYDFLVDSATRIRARWEDANGLPGSPLFPLDGELIGDDWNGSDAAAREAELLSRLGGPDPVGIASLSGHATHFELGVPGLDIETIEGLDAVRIYGSDRCPPSDDDTEGVDLAGAVIYAVGCHGGLPVPDTCDPMDDEPYPLDLPQTLLAKGVQAYVANTGYGWGLLHGIGYSERLVELLTDEITKGGTVVVGRAVRQTKLRYFLEAPRLDAYDEKSLMQWTTYGFPMYAIQTGIDPGDPAKSRELGIPVERSSNGALAGVEDPGLDLPDHLTRVDLRFDLTADEVYSKRSAAGLDLGDVAGCPDPDGCYYALNDLSTGASDLPIQPYFVYDSRLSGTSQHGVLWRGGDYDEEDGWIPVIAQLVSNAGTDDDTGATPRTIVARPRPRTRPTGDGNKCPSIDFEPSSVVVTTGETLKRENDDPSYDVQRTYRTVDLEVFYFNNLANPAENCDLNGPSLEPDHVSHHVTGSEVNWLVTPPNPDAVWRVVVVYDDEALDAWVPVDLVRSGDGWGGSANVAGLSRITYVVQAVDRRGNVGWLDYTTDDLPASGVELGLPLPVDVPIDVGSADLSIGVTDAPDPILGMQVLLYTLRVDNRGPDPTGGVEVELTLPSGAAFLLANGTDWSCAYADRVVCQYGSLVSGAAPPITVAVAVPAVPSVLFATAAVSTVETADSDPSNNEQTVTTTVVVDPLVARPGPDRSVEVDASTVLGDTPAAGGGIPPYAYAWTLSPPEGATLSNGSSGNPTFQAWADGTYSAELQVTDAAGIQTTPVGITIVATCPVGCTCENVDGDPVSSCRDCTDDDARVYPGAEQLCDGIDNSCDPAWDPQSEVDADGDGFSPCSGDCDDTRSGINPDGVESCNALDDDCNGLVDEDAAGEDTDGDGAANACDNCRGTFNPDQADADGDARGDVCDNCVVDRNPSQSDIDADGEGDVCDLGDGVIYTLLAASPRVQWQEETGFDSWNLYRGDLAELKTSGTYTQDPQSIPLANQVCDLPTPWWDDSLPLASGETVFYLVTGNDGGVENHNLGHDGSGNTRPSGDPCP